MLSRLLLLCSHQLMFQMLKPGELGSHLLQTLDGFIFVLSRCSKITIVIIHTSLIITRKIMEKLLMGHYSTNLTISRSSMCKLLTYLNILAMGRSCTSARQLVSTLVWVRWSTTLYSKWNQKGRNFIQWIPSERHESFSPNLELQKKIQFTKGGADRQLNLWIYPPPRPWRDWPPSHCPAFALFPRSYSLTIFIISKLLFC